MWRKNFPPSLPTLAVFALASGLSVLAHAWSLGPRISRTHAVEGPDSSLTRRQQKRFVMLKHGSTPDGARVIFTSDQLLEDYNSYVEGERFYVLIPQANLVGVKEAPSGRGFADMRVEQHGDDVLLSFILREGATVNFNQKFNRLDVNFIINEPMNKEKVARAPHP